MTDTEHDRLNDIRRRYVKWVTSGSTSADSTDAWMDDIGFLLMRITELQTELWSYGLGDPE